MKECLVLGGQTGDDDPRRDWNHDLDLAEAPRGTRDVIGSAAMVGRVRRPLLHWLVHDGHGHEPGADDCTDTPPLDGVRFRRRERNADIGGVLSGRDAGRDRSRQDQEHPGQ